MCVYIYVCNMYVYVYTHTHDHTYTYGASGGVTLKGDTGDTRATPGSSQETLRVGGGRGMAGRARARPRGWVFITGECSGRGVQWMGVVLYHKLVYNII